MAMMLAGASLLPQGAASEVCEKGEEIRPTGASLFRDIGWLVLLAGLVCLLHLMKDLGLEIVRRLVARKECLKVKLLDEAATLPSKGSPGAAGWDVSTSMNVQIAPGERKLVSTGLALEIPRGCYGRLASRSSLAVRGVDVTGGVIDADYRGEIKIMLVNQGNQEISFEVGDRIAQVVLEKISDVSVMESHELSNTRRGAGGFGSSGVAIRSLRTTGTHPEPEESPHESEPPVQERELHDRGARVPEGRDGLCLALLGEGDEHSCGQTVKWHDP